MPHTNNYEWTNSDKIDSGAFGEVYRVSLHEFSNLFIFRTVIVVDYCYDDFHLIP